MPDGVNVLLNWFQTADMGDDTPIVVTLHGTGERLPHRTICNYVFMLLTGVHCFKLLFFS